MKVLVTGGLGYLGGCLVQLLSNSENYEVIIGSRKKAIASFAPNATVVTTNWSSQSQLESVCEGVDIIIHLAAMDAENSLANPVAALEMNGLGTARLLEAAISKRVSRFIYLSTSHIYGNISSGIISEKTFPLPIHPYATSHRAGEDVVFSSNQLGKIKGIILRLSNCFGKPADKNANCWNLLVQDLCKQAIENHKLVLKSDGLQMRNFIPIMEACRAIEHFVKMQPEDNIPPIINIGSTENMSVLGMAELIQARYEFLFKESLIINRTSPKEGERNQFYKYSIDLLEQTGFHSTKKISSTIDDLLMVCYENYDSKR